MTTETFRFDLHTAQDISEEILAIDWTLTREDLNIILSSCRGASENYLKFAIQLCQLRKYGRFLQHYHQVPIKAIPYLARQLECDPVLCITQSGRMATEYEYRHKIRNYLGFHDFDLNLFVESQLNDWISQQLHQEIYLSSLLVEKAEAFLLDQKIILPSIAELKKKISAIRIEVQQKIYEKISEKITNDMRSQIKALLLSPQNQTLSDLQQYKRSPPEPRAKIINEFLDRLDVLQKINIHQISLSDIHPQVVDECYRLVCTYNARDLQRLKPDSKRDTLLICFLVESYKLLLDHIVDLNHKMLEKKERISKNKFKKNQYVFGVKADNVQK